jgi:diacylglycerol kinase (ATP)
VKKASIIFNPFARNAPALERLRAAGGALRTDGWEIEVLATEASLHAVSLASEAANRGSEVVFACGGDGTVNEVVNGLAGKQAALGIIRGGTGNVFGKEVHVPRRLNDALRVLADGEDYCFDIGQAGDRNFLLMAGVGFDGSVVRRVPTGPKRLLGTTSYVIWGAAEAVRFQSRQVDLVVDGKPEDIELYWLLVANTRSYGGVVDVASTAIADDGLFDAYAFAGRGLPWMLMTGSRIALRRHHGAPGVHFHRAARIEIVTPGLDVQADGEYFGQTPMSFSIIPHALSVRLPKGGARHLISNPVSGRPADHSP